MILITRINKVSKATYNWGAPHCSWWVICLLTKLIQT